MKKIEDYTVDELSQKIEAIKAEREKTANALKRYEEELERKKREVPVGVPLKDMTLAAVISNYHFGFESEASQFTFSFRLNDYVKALQKLAKGEPIDINVLCPLLKKGWVAMNRNNEWHWYKEKPYISKYYYCWNTGNQVSFIGGFNIKPAENWETSLMECGL